MPDGNHGHDMLDLEADTPIPRGALDRPQDPVPDGAIESGAIDFRQEHPRDRIVILGRRRAGKTIYLARMYEQLWKSDGRFHMRALSGETHKACMKVIDELSHGTWPASTLGAQYSDIEIVYRDEKHLLVALDYPGEVFRKAFVDDADTDDARELLEHVDRAAAVIVLLDPAVAHSGKMEEAIDDDFGMVQAIHRIREWPGGEDVPIVVVLTKCDIRKGLLREHGGLRRFAAQKYPNLVRAMGRFKIYASSAVRATRGENGELIPTVGDPPIGIIEPLEYCLRKISERDEDHREREAARTRLEACQRRKQAAHETKRKTILFWSIFWSVVTAIMGITAIVTWMLTHSDST